MLGYPNVPTGIPKSECSVISNVTLSPNSAVMPDDFDANLVFARSQNAIGAEVNGQTTLLHSVRWQYLEFNPVAEEIWRLLETPRTLPEIVEALRSEFDVDESTCRDQVEVFLQEMQAKDYITTTPPR